MLEYLKDEANRTYTENGAATYRTTNSDCLDLFATIGALRKSKAEEVKQRFMRAFAENRDIAMKLAFYARDVRGGLGERNVFRVILRWLASHAPESLRKNIQYIAEFGRFDDLVSLLNTPCEADAVSFIKSQLDTDMRSLANEGEGVSLLGKWLPSVNASNPQTVANAKHLARALGMNDAQYRRTMTSLRARIKILENYLRESDYSFDYSKQPSKAMYKYRKAFARNDGERYQKFLESVAAGNATLHTGTLMPYDIVAPFVEGSTPSDDERRAADVTWNALEDFTRGENALAVVDGSGSMYGGAQPIPASVALSLGIYFAERNTGTFRNHFITFSMTPRLVEIKGKDIYEKVQYCKSFNEVANTDIQKVFELVLNTAVKHGVPQEELPSTIYIISDMEFDYCAAGADITNFEYAKNIFEEHGYTLPQVVFWNVSSRNQQQPVKMNERGVCLVSGCTARTFSMVMSGDMSPYAYMMEVLGSERYAKIEG